MTWVIDRGGIIVYKAGWSNAGNIEAFIQRYYDARRERRPGAQLASYYTEQVELRALDPEAFDVRLQRYGRRAVEQWRLVQEIRRSRETT